LNSLRAYIKECILLEGRYDQVVNDLSRDIVSLFGKDYYTEMEDFFVEGATVELIIDYAVDNAVKGFDFVLAYSDNELIEIEISYNPSDFPAMMNEFIYELKEVLRHEIEHVTQYLYPSKQHLVPPKNRRDLASWEYFTAPEEIPAHVRGFYKRSKTSKIPLDIIIDTFLDERRGMFDDESKIAFVKDEWLKYAKKFLPAAIYSYEE